MKMRRFRQDKLWRDKLPSKMEAMGSVLHSKDLTDEEYDSELRKKLIEECNEVVAAQSKIKLMSEMADIYEALDALMKLHDIDRGEVQSRQDKKRNERGGFFMRQYVTVADHPVGGFGEEYCLADPDKYPEVTEY